jgi:hypothetical protein
VAHFGQYIRDSRVAIVESSSGPIHCFIATSELFVSQY